MDAIPIAPDIYWIGANISTNDLFEGIWPVPNGVTLNSYVIKGDKIALIDLVRDWQGAPIYLTEQLKSIGVTLDKIDIIVLNHLEPDHTGWTGIMKMINPNAEIYTTAKGAELVSALFKIEDNVHVVQSGDQLDLGNDKTLIFQEIPNVHWPETMVTYEVSTKTLFTCDAFGSFGAFRGGIFDDEALPMYKEYYDEETLRYYANIVGPFSDFVLKALNTVVELGIEIKTIAPSHGLLWRANPGDIIHKYEVLANYMNDYAEPEICVVYGSMYGNTEHMLRQVLQGIASEGVMVHLYKIPDTNFSYVQAMAWRCAGIVIGAPTYEYKLFPAMANFIDLCDRKHVWHKKAIRFGSFGWSGGAKKQFDDLTKNLKWEVLGEIDFRGAPTTDEMQQGFALGQQIAQAVKEIPRKL